MTTTARREGDKIVITVDVEDAQSLRVALQPCPCKSTKSLKTSEIRERFVRGLGEVLARPKRSDAAEKGEHGHEA